MGVILKVGLNYLEEIFIIFLEITWDCKNPDFYAGKLYFTKCHIAFILFSQGVKKGDLLTQLLKIG